MSKRKTRARHSLRTYADAHWVIMRSTRTPGQYRIYELPIRDAPSRTWRKLGTMVWMFGTEYCYRAGGHRVRVDVALEAGRRAWGTCTDSPRITLRVLAALLRERNATR